MSQVPLTRDEIASLLVDHGFPIGDMSWFEEALQIARLVEAAHGISMFGRDEDGED